MPSNTCLAIDWQNCANVERFIALSSKWYIRTHSTLCEHAGPRTVPVLGDIGASILWQNCSMSAFVISWTVRYLRLC
jgi:hypothetical protein